MSLCKSFPALTPFAVRRERAHEVFLLVRRINKQPKHDGGRVLDNQGRIRQHAGDKWF